MRNDITALAKLELSACVLLGKENHAVATKRVAAAAYERLARMGASVDDILDAIARLSDERLIERVATKLDEIQWFETTLRGGKRAWDVVKKKKKKRVRAAA